jgi:mono/diheme cytochrome c family protein
MRCRAGEASGGVSPASVSLTWRHEYSMRTAHLARAAVLITLGISCASAADPEVLRPRVPRDQVEAARQLRNPLPATPDMIAKGKELFEGKAFCRACHGADGKGLSGPDIEPGSLKGLLPRNFTDRGWQTRRTDGELMWILKNGSPGTDMGPFIPLVLTEEEAWQVLLYVRSFAAK